MRQTITLLLLIIIGSISCTGNSRNIVHDANEENDTVEIAQELDSTQDSQEDSICSNPDTRPKYNAKDPVGFMIDFLRKNLHYPEEAVKKELQGTVIVQMVVERDGTPTHFEVVREVDPLLDNETLRIAKLLPKFIPAQKDGKPVRCIFNFSVPFRL
jgi:TonB family protein